MLPGDQLLNRTQTVSISANCKEKGAALKKTIKLTDPSVNYALLTSIMGNLRASLTYVNGTLNRFHFHGIQELFHIIYPSPISYWFQNVQKTGTESSRYGLEVHHMFMAVEIWMQRKIEAKWFLKKVKKTERHEAVNNFVYKTKTGRNGRQKLVENRQENICSNTFLKLWHRKCSVGKHRKISWKRDNWICYCSLDGTDSKRMVHWYVSIFGLNCVNRSTVFLNIPTYHLEWSLLLYHPAKMERDWIILGEK